MHHGERDSRGLPVTRQQAEANILKEEEQKNYGLHGHLVKKKPGTTAEEAGEDRKSSVAEMDVSAKR
jgi:hypothetical protein